VIFSSGVCHSSLARIFAANFADSKFAMAMIFLSGLVRFFFCRIPFFYAALSVTHPFPGLL